MATASVGRSVIVAVIACLAAVNASNAQSPDDGGMFGGPRKPKPAENTPAKPVAPGELKPLEQKKGSWSIVLASFRGEKQVDDATAMLSHITGQKDLAGAFIDQRGGGKATVVAIGKFPDPSSSEALARLDKVRGIVVDGKKPYAGAFLAPPGELTNLGQRPEFNLARAKEQFGDRAVYSLQVAAYGRKDIIDEQKRSPTEEELKEARRAAEEAVASLRQQGELAFFYHGPRYSMVTIGVWNDGDFAHKGDPQAGVAAHGENPDLTSLRKRFPNNLYNGAGVKVKSKVEGEQMQASFIVRIPER